MTPPRGRPRDETADARILAAAARQLLTGGYPNLTVDGVAAETGIAKTTLYRRWPTKDHLAIATVAHIQDEVPVTDTGDLATDLTRYLTAIAVGLDTMRRAGVAGDTAPPGGGAVAELVGATGRHHDLAEASRRQFAKRNRLATDLIARAVTEGRIRSEVDPTILFDQLAGALYYRVLISHQPVDTDYVAALVAQALTGLHPTEIPE